MLRLLRLVAMAIMLFCMKMVLYCFFLGVVGEEGAGQSDSLVIVDALEEVDGLGVSVGVRHLDRRVHLLAVARRRLHIRTRLQQ